MEAHKTQDGTGEGTPAARLREGLVWGFFAVIAVVGTVLDVLYFHLWS